MKRLMIMALAAVAGTVLLVVAALATDADDVVTELELRGYFIERGAGADFDALEQLAAEWPDIYFIVLAQDPSGGTDLLASETLVALRVEGTVIVVSPFEIGARSTIYSDAELDAAVDRAFDLFDSSYTDGFASFAGALSDTSATSGSGGGGFIFLLVIVGIGALIWWAIRRSNRNRESMFQNRIEEVKAEIQSQLSEAANDILELEDDILLSDNDDAKELYYSGSAAYAEFQERLAGASNFAELDELAEGADLALWQLESAEAMLDSRSPPAKPKSRPDFEPPQPTTPQPAVPQRRHPELPEDLQLRRDRRAQRGSRPRGRSSGGLGGLGAAAMILRSLQQGDQPTVGPTRSAVRNSRSTRGQTPHRGGPSSSTRRSNRTRRRSTNSRQMSSTPRLKGRTRRRRK